MVIRIYDNKKINISPKSKKISTYTTEIILDVDKDYILSLKQRKTKHRTSTIISGFKFSELDPKFIPLKENKRRTKNKKYIG